jgi:hypothetical protein
MVFPFPCCWGTLPLGAMYFLIISLHRYFIDRCILGGLLLCTFFLQQSQPKYTINVNLVGLFEQREKEIHLPNKAPFLTLKKVTFNFKWIFMTNLSI